MAYVNGSNGAHVQHSNSALRMAEEGTLDAKADIRDGDITPQLKQTKPSPAHPLGLLCFGLTTVMLMFMTTGWAESVFMRNMITYALFYGGFGQILAGIFELVSGNPFAGTAFVSYGAFWCGYFLTAYFNNTGVLTGPIGAGNYHVGETLFLCLWGFFTLGLFIPTLRRNKCLMTVFGTLTLTFFLLAGGQWNAGVNKAAGYVGFFCGCSAIYTAFAELYEATFKIKMPGLAHVRYL